MLVMLLCVTLCQSSSAQEKPSPPHEVCKMAVHPYSASLFPVSIDGKYGYIDDAGSIVIAPQFSSAMPFSEGLANVRNEHGITGYINTNAVYVIRPQFLAGFSFSDGLAAVENTEQKWGYVDRVGTWVIPAEYDAAYPFENGVAKVGDQGPLNEALVKIFDAQMKCNWYYIDKVGNRVNVPKRGPGLHPARKNGKWGFVDEDGRIVVEYRFNDARQFSEELAAVKKSEFWGYVDRSGDFVISPRFRDAKQFSEGRAAVLFPESRGYAYIDRKGDVAIKPRFGIAHEFSHGLAKVGVDGKYGYIDREGNWIWKPTK